MTAKNITRILERLSKAQIILAIVVLAILTTEPVVILMEWLLTGRVTYVAWVTGLVSSTLVSSLLGYLFVDYLVTRITIVKSTNELKKSLSLLNATLESTADAILVVDGDGRISDFNQQFIKMWGVPSDIFIDRNDDKATACLLAQLADPDAFVAKVRELYVNPKQESFDTVLFKDGRHIERYSRPQLLDGKSIGRVWSFRDVTQRKLAERELIAAKNMLQTVIETLPARVFWKDRDSRYLGANARFAQDAGLAGADEIIGKQDAELTWREQAELYRADDRWVMEFNNTKLAYEEPQTTPDGKRIWLRTSKVPLKNEQGEIVGVLGVYDDITLQKETERELRITQAGIDEGRSAYLRLTPTGLVSYANEYACEILGYTHAELMGMPVWEFEHYLKQADVAATWKTIRDTGLLGVETKFRRKDGSLYPVEVTATYGDYQGEEFIFVFVQDISARKQAEKIIRDTSATYVGILNSLYEAVYILDEYLCFLDVNAAVLRMYDYPREKFIGQPYDFLVAPERNDIPYIEGLAQRAFQGEQLVCEMWGLRRNGEAFPKEMHFSPGTYFGKPCLIVLAIDITRRKHDAQKLADSEQRWKFALEGAGSGVWDWVVGAEEMFISSRVKALFGYAEADIENSFNEWVSRINPLDKQRVTSHLQDYLEGKLAKYEVEHRILDKQGNWQWIRVRGMASQRDAQGRPLRLVGTAENITESKEAEGKLLGSQSLLRSTLESIDEGILMVSQDGHVLATNRRFQELWQVPSALLAEGQDDLLLGHVLKQLVDTEAFLSQVRRLYDSDDEARDVLHFKDGRVFSRYTRAMFVAGVRGRIWCFKDITEMFAVQQQLQVSNDNLELTLKAIPDLMFEFDGDGRYMEIFAHNEALLAAQKQTLLGHTVSEMLPPDAAGIVMSALKDAEQHGYSSGQVIQLELPNGTSWFELSTSVKSNAAGKKLFITLSRDITERRRIETSLANNEKRLHLALKAAQMGVWEFDFGSGELYWSPEIYRQFGVPNVRPSRELRLKMIHPEDVAISGDAMRAAIAKQSLYHAEYRVYVNGRIVWVEDRGEIQFDTQGQPLKVAGTAQDITQQKVAHDLLVSSEKEYRRLVEELPCGVVIHRDGKILLANRMAAKLFAAENQQALIGVGLLSLVHPDYHAIVKERVHAMGQGQDSGMIEEKLLRLDGKVFDAEVSALSIMYDEQKASLALFNDITKRKQAERRIF